MKVTEFRTMLYLPAYLYRNSRAAAHRQKKSLAAFIREALERYFANPPEKQKREGLHAGFGLWKDRKESGIAYENRLRSSWNTHGPRSR